MKGHAWTDAEVAEVEHCIDLGMGNAAIAEHMDKTSGQIAGLVHRRGLTGRRRPQAASRTKNGTKPTSARAPRPSDAIMRHRTCQYPVGDPREPGFHFCDKPLPVVDGRPYCPTHERKCTFKNPAPKGEFKMHGWPA